MFGSINQCFFNKLVFFGYKLVFFGYKLQFWYIQDKEGLYWAISLMQQRKENTGFNIRKVYKKNFSISKNPEELPVYTPEIQFEKSYEHLTYSNSKKEKELMLDQAVNEAVLNSKTYIDLKRAYQQNKRKNNERLEEVNQEVHSLKTEKSQLQQEKQKINSQKARIREAIEQMTQKIQALKQQNEQRREHVENIYQTEAEYFNQLLLSMRFHAEYEHNIDPDQMTYEELLELEEKIGNVSKGLPLEVIEAMEKTQVRQEDCGQEDKCAVCYCNFEVKQVMTRLRACKHEFHFDCLKTWLLKEKVCPLCKQQIKIERREVREGSEQEKELEQNNQQGRYMEQILQKA